MRRYSVVLAVWLSLLAAALPLLGQQVGMGPFVPGGLPQSYAFASLPAAATGQEAFCTNCGTGGMKLRYNGTRWKPVNGSGLLASSDAVVGSVNAGDTIVWQYQLPASLLSSGDSLRVAFTGIKSGTTNTGSITFHVGTAGTTSDTTINTSTTSCMGASARSCGSIVDLRVESTTTMREMGIVNASVMGYGPSSGGAQPSAATLASSATIADSLYFSVGIAGGATDTMSLSGAQLWWIASAN